jgi:hypothetical protein
MEQRPDHAQQPRVLGDLLVGSGVVVARCRCGAVTPLPLVAASADLRQAALGRLEQDLRCTCGARSGAIELWPQGLPTPASRDRLFLFAS